MVEGGGLENRCAKAPWVRILLPPPRVWRGDREADGARLLSECGGQTPPRVRIPPPPPDGLFPTSVGSYRTPNLN